MKKFFKKIYYSLKYFLKAFNIIKDSFEVHLVENEQELKEIYSLRFQVYCEERGYLESSNYPDKLEKDDYDDDSIHFIAKDKWNNIVGAARFIKSNNLQTDEYIDLPQGVNRKKTVEVSRLIVAKNCRGKGHEVTFCLAKEMIKYSLDHQIDFWLAVYFTSTWRIFNRLKIPFEIFGEPRAWHHVPGFFLMPVVLRLDYLFLFLKNNNSILFRYLINGLNKEQKKIISEKIDELDSKKTIDYLKDKIEEDWKKYKDHL